MFRAIAGTGVRGARIIHPPTHRWAAPDHKQFGKTASCCRNAWLAAKSGHRDGRKEVHEARKPASKDWPSRCYHFGPSGEIFGDDGSRTRRISLLNLVRNPATDSMNMA